MRSWPWLTLIGPAVEIWTPNGQKAEDMVGCERGDTETEGAETGSDVMI